MIYITSFFLPDNRFAYGYDFEYNDSIYVVFTESPNSPNEAQSKCAEMFLGSGHLVSIASKQELMALSTELKVMRTLVQIMNKYIHKTFKKK